MVSHDLSDVLNKANSYGFDGKTIGDLVSIYDNAQREYLSTHPAPIMCSSVTMALWIENKHLYAYQRACRALYNVVDDLHR